MQIAARTETGKVRKTNQDSIFKVYKENEYLCAAVADGMGGHNCGEMASTIALETFAECIKQNVSLNISNEEIIKKAVKEANKKVYEKAMNDEQCNGMGTTLTALIIKNGILTVGHVGDSRAYIITNKGIEQITKDHSVVEELVRMGKITNKEKETHPQKNMITRAVGTDENVDVDIFSIKYTGETVLLSTDGLTNHIEDKELYKSIIKNGDDFQKAIDEIMTALNKTKANDNASIIVCKY